MKALTLCALLVPVVALADSPFDGTWVARQESLTMDPKPYVFSLASGVFESKISVPPIKVKADGTDQPVTGHASIDTIAVKSDGPDSLTTTAKKAGKQVGGSTYTVSADGRTLTQ